MAKKSSGTEAGGPDSASTTSEQDLIPTVEALTQAAQALDASARQIMQMMKQMQSMMQVPAARTQPASVVAGRHLVYVHGICKHPAGFSDEWWDALHPFTDAFVNGTRDETRLEVLWSDLV